MAAIGEAYVGPATLNIRREISMQSPPVATVKHGDRLEILQQRRVFFRVRTAGGAEGWTSGSQLLGASDMADMRQLAERAARMPAQGQATTYDILRVHSLPSARSPGFIELQPKENFAVLGHVVMPRIELPRAPLIPSAPKKAPPRKKESKAPAKLPPPPLPPPPALPANWQELSKPELDEEDLAQREPEPAAPPALEDDWSLVRTTGGQTGWVLTRRTSMAIPDEVAQYAEGRRIVSYFSLGSIDDGDAKKDIWLWTIAPEGHPSYDFESFRVFIWSLRRHRYETAYIERRIEGHAPVLLDRENYAGSGKGKGAPEKFPGFSICMRKQNGSLVRRRYVLLTNVVRFAGESGCELPPPIFNPAAVAKAGGLPLVSPPAGPPAAAQKPGLATRLKEKLLGWWPWR